ncbi:GntR family transcriptional regulator [Leisingera daeponensis]|uniref:GntR family transcriptional regulator n=1 Tax=Leisingera daeponensis TaxID=405746 RepID=UPI001C94F463|nr:GntR family transcriptional regulator [Leisingera daeponensis]MBY6058378.1 GntR family transcriptional regulator [Leisingera daeponensis]
MTQSRDAQLLTEKAQEALSAALRSGRLRDGQFLSMSQLVTMLGLPLAAVREAVKHASSQGLLVTLPKRGIRVMEARPETIRDCLDFRMALDQEGARRRIAGADLAGLVTLRRRHQDFRETALQSAAGGTPDAAIEVDLSLHDFLAAGLGNPQLAAAYAANRMRIAIIQNARPFLQDRIVSAMEEHLAIIDALDNRDTGAATEAIRHHFDQTLRWWGVT